MTVLAHVTIAINGINDAPVSMNISAATIVNTNTIIALVGSDIEYDALTYIIVALPENGQLKDGETVIVETDLPKTLTQNELNYIPSTDYKGSDTFPYKVNDGVLDSETSKVTIKIAQGYLDTQTKLGLDLNGEANDYQGQSIAFNEDATIMAVGANEHDNKKGTVRVYKMDYGSWTQVGEDIDGTEANDSQGFSVSLSSDGNTLAVGATGHDSNKGTVRVYRLSDDNVWTQLGSDLDGIVADDYQGSSVSLSKNGLILAVGAYGHDSNKGTVRLYQYVSNSWAQLGDDLDGKAENDYHGRSVSLSGDGLTLAVGATGVSSNTGASRIYKYDSSTWTQLGEDINGTDAEDYHGNSISISSSGTTLAVGAWGHDSYKGTARVYRYASSSWGQIGEDLDGEAADDYQGWSVSLSSNGLTLAVGAYGHDSNKGTVRIYNIEAEKSGSANRGTVTLNSQSSNWTQIGNDIDGSGSSSDSSGEKWSSTLDGGADDKQGYSVSISSDGITLAVGALGHDNNKGTIRAYSLVSDAPTKVNLNGNNVDENKNTSEIGEFSTEDIGIGDVFTYELVNGEGDTDNSLFTIDSNKLKNIDAFDFESVSDVFSSIGSSLDFSNDKYPIIINNINDIQLNSVNNTYCEGSYANGSIFVTPSNTNGTISYSWTGPNNFTSSDQNPSSLEEGTFSVLVKDDYFEKSFNLVIEKLESYDGLSICYVTSDSEDFTKNRVFLSYQDIYNDKKYEILREGSSAGVYEKIGEAVSWRSFFFRCLLKQLFF